MKSLNPIFLIVAMAAAAFTISGCARHSDPSGSSPHHSSAGEIFEERTAGISADEDSGRPPFAPFSQAYAVRRLNWGDSIEDVRDKETGKYTGGNESLLLYEDDLCGQKARIMHSFEKGRLDCIMYDVSETGMDAEDWISYHLQVKDYLAARYGTPCEDFMIAPGGVKTDECTPEELAAGGAGFLTLWDTKRCYIWLQTVSDEEHGITLSLVFTEPNAQNETESEEIEDETKQSPITLPPAYPSAEAQKTDP